MEREGEGWEERLMVGILERLGQAFENLEPLFLIVQASAQILLNTSKSCLLLSISLVVFTASYLCFDPSCNARVLFLRRINRNIKNKMTIIELWSRWLPFFFVHYCFLGSRKHQLAPYHYLLRANTTCISDRCANLRKPDSTRWRLDYNVFSVG